MAKYSKEQRDRAVDLYVRYERCAADVIRELGYPSRGMLPVWYRERLEEERTGVPSRRGERYRRYADEQKRAAVDHYLGHGRRLKRTMRALGYPKSHELLTAWIDELAPGRRKLRHGPVPEELKRKAVVAVASGRSESRDAAAGLGVEASVVGKLETADARRIQGDARDEDTWREAPTAGEGKTSVEPSTPAARGTRPAWRTRWRRWRRGWRRRGPVWTSWTPMSSGSGGRRGNWTSRSRSGRARWSCWEKSRAQSRKSPASREKAVLVKQTSERLGVTAGSLLPVVGIARGTYHYQLNAMKRPDKDSGLLELVREAFENSKRGYGYKRVHLEPESMASGYRRNGSCG